MLDSGIAVGIFPHYNIPPHEVGGYAKNEESDQIAKMRRFI